MNASDMIPGVANTLFTVRGQKHFKGGLEFTAVLTGAQILA
jgi:hypothetical protein